MLLSSRQNPKRAVGFRDIVDAQDLHALRTGPQRTGKGLRQTLRGIVAAAQFARHPKQEWTAQAVKKSGLA